MPRESYRIFYGDYKLETEYFKLFGLTKKNVNLHWLTNLK